MKIYYSDDFTLGLFSFLAQIELSVHRGMDCWSDLRDYFSEKDIFRTIDNILISEKRQQYQMNIPLWRKYFYSVIRKRYITDTEWNDLSDLLIDVSALLRNDNPDREEIIKLRMRLRVFALVIRGRLKVNGIVLKLADRVEHFYENEHMVHYSINQIVANVNNYSRCNKKGSIWEYID
ncbi:hypothetical protein HM25_002480 [Salmonella enterica subsp. enterica serovar Carno]|nr:hypothetical protein [Salmonella enterica subsp. enterica serovar Carno]